MAATTGATLVLLEGGLMEALWDYGLEVLGLVVSLLGDFFICLLYVYKGTTLDFYGLFAFGFFTSGLAV